MARKIVNNSDPGTSTVFGGNDLDYVNQYLTGTDQTASDPVTINTQTTFTKAVIDSQSNTLKNLGSAYYYVYYDGANFFARNMKTGAIDSTDTDAATVIQYALTNSGVNKGKVFLDAQQLFQLSTSLSITTGRSLEGAGSQLSQLRPTGNFPAIVIAANSHNMQLHNLFVTHAQSGYTSSLIQFREGSSAAFISNVDFYDFDYYVGSCFEFYNNAAASAGAGIYDHFISNCASVGFAQNFLVTIPNSTNWVNGIHINGGWFDGSKYLIKSNAAGATTAVDGWQITDTDWQYESFNATPTGEAAIMFDDTATHYWTKMNGLMCWDTPSDRNMLNTNSSSDYYLTGAVPDTKIAGSGFTTLDGNGSIRKNWSRTATETITNKTMSTDSNTIKHSTTNNAGDILKNTGTKFDRLARGTALQVLQVNSGATDVGWASLESERTGKSTASGDGSTTVFNIAHGLGSTPSYAFVDCSSQTIARTFTVNSTNIVVTFASAPASGSNNVVIYWRVIA